MSLLNPSTSNKRKSEPAQNFVPIQEVRDGIIVLKDGSMRAIMLTSSVNFALKSENEQQALIAQFQNFLNALEFSVQIFIQSRRLDIRPYLALLEERYREQTGDLMRVQTREYIEFIKSFTESTNIMTKSFFVIIPFTPAIIQSGQDLVGSFLGRNKKNAAGYEATQFEENRTQLEQRIAVVEQGLTRLGVRAVQLGSEEVIELFYKLFNPGELDKPAVPGQQ